MVKSNISSQQVADENKKNTGHCLYSTQFLEIIELLNTN